MTHTKHHVVFRSPGTFFHEESSRPIASWDTKVAAWMAKEITERHGARPFGFYFVTNIEADPIPDGAGGTLNVEPKKIAESGMYFLGGKLRRLDDVEAENKEDEHILRSNMRGNGMHIVVENRNSYRSTNPFGEKDVIVDVETGEVFVRGDDPFLVEYRKKTAERVKRELEAEMAVIVERKAGR